MSATTPAHRPEDPRSRAGAGPAGQGRIPRNAVTVTPYRDGPLLVRGPFRLLRADGSAVARHSGPVALCRCGRSQTKPFCDGTHKLVGFRSA